MYLKSIEIQGFKSFANKLVFSFHTGFTGIVGPNGSGKSNVADAVRWVLGEQSASKLRGSNMQDIIFAGTETRKPLSFAYVAITFDNADHALPIDFTEVTVARRVYRSGESEYILNGNACRLKDVQELFYDTGIGKEGYSIIGQGQIDRILSKHPEERRELFDEAAGIVKFKRSKAATIKKLEKERENLQRINDVLSEQEKQLAPLERQSEGAREFLKKREELKKLDINAYLMEMERISAELAKVEEDIANTDAQLASVKQEKHQNETDYNMLQNQIDDLDKLTEEVNRSLNEAVLKKQRLEGEINVFREQINSIKNSDVQFAERLRVIDTEIDKRRKSVAEYESQTASLQENLDAAAEKTAAAGGKLSEIQAELSKRKGEVEESKSRLIALMDQMSGLKADAQKYETMSEQLKIRRADINKKTIANASEDQEQKEALEEAKKALDQILDQREALIAQRDESASQMEEWQEKEAALREALNSAKEEYQTKRSRLEALANIAERYEGYGGATRAVLEMAGEHPGILGVVANLMRVDSKYETAIEVCLGGSIQNIVTDNEATAKEMIEYLKKNRLGRVTFLPITNVRGSDNSKYERGLQEKGAIGMADTLIECDLKYQGVYKYLLGRTMIVDNIDNAYAIARKYNFSLHLVTLDGEYLAPGGSVSGGAFRNKSNLLGRNRELSDLKKSVANLETTIKQAQERMDDVRTAAELCQDDYDQIQAQIHELDIELGSAKVRYEQMEEKGREARKANEELFAEEQSIGEELERIEAEKSRVAQALADAESEKDGLESRDDDISGEIEALSERETKENEIYQSMQIEEARARTALGYAVENIERLNGEIKTLGEESDTIDATMKEHQGSIIDIQSGIDEIEKAIETGTKEIEALRTSQSENAKERERLFSDNKEFYAKNDEINERLSGLEKELLRQTDRKHRLTESKETQDAYIWEEYELTLHNCKDMRDSSLDSLPSLKRQIGGIKEEIKALGPVNVNAIEDYKDLYERYTTAKTQRDDIVEAEKTLVLLIDELEKGMRAQFSEKFAEIQVEFDKAFKELFGGGKGTLEIMEDEDILEAGILVIAQPPGKKVQNMMQLSGGERALTAIALLFAIQNLKPSPFCLLDEIEAALDDSNVDRFAKYLKKLSDKSQFIVITHRRGTMNAADCLYGITMQEKGVSALVSVNLIDAELDA